MPKTQAKRGMSPRELDALRKRYVAEQKQADSASKWQLANDIVSGINDIVGRGVIAPILGMPGDINQAIYDAGAFVNNKIKDVEVATGMVKQPRYVRPTQGNAYLGSEDIGNRMQQAGLVSSERRPMTELAASFVSPSAAAKTAINAPKTAMNMLRMAENLEAPSRGVRNAQGMYIPRGQMGAIENLYHASPHTFDRFDLSKIGTGEGAKALREAQINAAKPVSEGGLGLRPDNTPEERAAAMGFDTDAVHFSRHGVDVNQLDSGKFATLPFDAVGTHVGTKEAAMDRFRDTVGESESIVGSTYPVAIRRGNEFMSPNGSAWDEDALSFRLKQLAGHDWNAINSRVATSPEMNAKLRQSLFSEYDSIPYYNDVEDKGSVSYIVPPQNIRSRFAAFDPMRRDSPDLLAGIALPVVAAPVVSESNKKKRKDKKK